MRHRRPDRSWLRAEAGVGVTPAGISQRDVRRMWASVGFQSGMAWYGVEGGIDLTWERVEIDGRARDAFILVASAGRRFEWGTAPPAPPFADRALPLLHWRDAERSGAVTIAVFRDSNYNGVRDPGEPGIEGAAIRIGRRDVSTGPGGSRLLVLPEGPHDVEIRPRGELVDLFAPARVTRVEIRAGRRSSLDTPLQPGARLAGRITFSGGEPPPGALGGIRVRARGAGGLEREAVTSHDGAFSFGVLPAGRWDVSIDPGTLSPETSRVDEGGLSIELAPESRLEIEIPLRRATARERILRRG
jgi:hypothetical protein